MGNAKGTELVKAADFGLTALDENSEVAEILAEALAGENVSPGDLERIKWPTGGGGVFERSVLGNTTHVDHIEGVIVHQRMTRAYFEDPEPKEGTQPNCTSPDGKWGYGDPGDALRQHEPPKGCEVCPMAAFGSARGPGGVQKRGQACNLRREFFILTPGAIFPTIVSIPPASLGEARGYVVDLASFGIRYYTVVTRIGLRKVASKDGQPYAEAVMSMSGKLDDASVEAVKGYRDRMLASLIATPVTAPAAGEQPVDGTAEEAA